MPLSNNTEYKSATARSLDEKETTAILESVGNQDSSSGSDIDTYTIQMGGGWKTKSEGKTDSTNLSSAAFQVE